MRTQLPWLAATGAALLFSGSLEAQVALTELVTINLDSTANPANPEFVGSNPNSVAWDGTDIYVTGFNNSQLAQPVAAAEVSDVLTAPSFGAAFFTFTSNPSFRGFTGMDVQGTTLVVTYDDGGSNPLGQTTWNTTSLTQIAAKNVRGSAGPAFDPGFGGAGTGIASLVFGSGRRVLDSDAMLNPIFDTSNGMIVVNTGGGSLWRDLTFDPSTGDFYGRRGNDVVKADRNAANDTVGQVGNLIVDNLENGNFSNQQNICFVNSPTFGDFLIYNDREFTTSFQPFDTIVMAIDTNGMPLTIDYNGFTAPVGSGSYDFDYHAPSNTLALLDSSNRNVTIFEVTDTVEPFDELCNGDGGDQMGCTDCPCGNNSIPGTIGGCVNPEGRSGRLRVSGFPSVMSDSLRFEMTDGVTSSFGLLISGAAVAPANAVNPCFGLDSGITAGNLDGLRCSVQDFLRHGTRSMDASGNIGTGVPGPGNNGWGPPSGPPGGIAATFGFTSGQTRYFQVFYRVDVAAGCQTGQHTTQAIRVDFQP